MCIFFKTQFVGVMLSYDFGWCFGRILNWNFWFHFSWGSRCRNCLCFCTRMRRVCSIDTLRQHILMLRRLYIWFYYPYSTAKSILPQNHWESDIHPVLCCLKYLQPKCRSNILHLEDLLHIFDIMYKFSVRFSFLHFRPFWLQLRSFLVFALFF